MHTAKSYWILSLTVLLLITGPSLSAAEKKPDKSIEEKTKIHRLNTKQRSAYDAFAYVNRIPPKAEEEESPQDFAGRIFGRLANQEGRVLIKLPKGMNRDAYLGFKTFMRTDAKASNGNCVACHAPEKFTDLKKHVVSQGGKALPTPSLRNMNKRKVNLRQIIMAKMSASEAKRTGRAKEIDKAYGQIHLNKGDLHQLMAFLIHLNDASDKDFRNYILNSEILDTTGDIE